jgi:hypothetical protein
VACTRIPLPLPYNKYNHEKGLLVTMIAATLVERHCHTASCASHYQRQSLLSKDLHSVTLKYSILYDWTNWSCETQRFLKAQLSLLEMANRIPILVRCGHELKDRARIFMLHLRME